jgi:hypothetical protein
MLVLDTRRMEFSVAQLPREAIKDDPYNLVDRIMVEAGEGMPGMFVLLHGGSWPQSAELNYTIMRYNGRWRSEKTISLDSSGFYSLRGSVGRYLLLLRRESSCYFTLDIKTFRLEKLCSSGIRSPRAYSNFPPSLLSSPTI